ncbi:zeta toxin-domain-containing protein [Ochromonadaceae sp. CCMP2298]|nr:zeta toxin-domain-containing protein [Ochromonadaceae sp. CCMP2298]
MGAGKGHTIQWLFQNDLFPFDAFVNVDPDAIRALLPEVPQYNAVDDQRTGHLTQKEVGYISEVLSYDALTKGRNVLVDGSLRNAHWYMEYFRNLRAEFPIVKIAILQVAAPVETVLRRAAKRALVTGRVVPEDVILDSIRSIPESFRLLSPSAEFVATFINEDDPPEPEPHVSSCTLQKDDCLGVLWHMQEYRVSEEEEGGEGGAQGGRYRYELKRFQDGVELEEQLDSWKDVFRNVWEMRCAMPSKDFAVAEAPLAQAQVAVALDGLDQSEPSVSGKKRKSITSS